MRQIFFTDPDRDVVLDKIEIEHLDPGLELFLLHEPGAAGTRMGNSGHAVAGRGASAGLFAWQQNNAQALVTTAGIRRATAGFGGSPSDPRAALSHSHGLGKTYGWAHHGHVVLAAELDPLPSPSVAWLALGFGTDRDHARRIAREALSADPDALLAKYVAQWEGYQSKALDLSPLSGDGGILFRSSLAILKSLEDKTHAGAFIASPTIPWGNTREDHFSADELPRDPSHRIGGYHLVWPRDLFQMANALMAVGDESSAEAALAYLRGIQLGADRGEYHFGSRHHPKNGAWAQTTWVDGTPFYSGLEIDEVAAPILLSFRLYKKFGRNPDPDWDMNHRAADFLADFGPWTQLDRWEDSMGVSPYSAALEMAALGAAAEMAERVHDRKAADRYQKTLAAWNRGSQGNIDRWTYTTTGALPGGHYYERIEAAADPDQTWNPDDDARWPDGNPQGTFREKDITDGGFLELVRLGFRSALDPHVATSIAPYDRSLRVEVPGRGPGFHRYTHDSYGFDPDTGRRNHGMLWPSLTGERGHYELAKALAQGLTPAEITARVEPFLTTMERFSTPQHILPEQVWDSGPEAGQPSGSAAPLGWAHAEYVTLLRSLQDRHVFDLVPGEAMPKTGPLRGGEPQ